MPKKIKNETKIKESYIEVVRRYNIDITNSYKSKLERLL